MSDTELERKLHAASMDFLKQHMVTCAYPMPHDNADLAAVVCRAFMFGVGFVAQATGLNSTPFVNQAEEFMRKQAQERSKPQLIIPGHGEWMG